MKQFISFILLLPLVALMACSKKSDDAPPATGVSNGLVTSAAGTYSMTGTVLIYPSCGTTTGTITISTYTGSSSYPYTNTTSGAAVGSVQVATGGTFNFPVAMGTYTISAVAGSCQVSGAGQALTNGQTAYRVCLSTGSECPRNYKVTDKAGSITIPATGSGDLNFDVANIYLSAQKASTFNLDLQFSSGNNLLNSVPSVAQGWSGSVGTDGSVKIGSLQVDRLSYSAQVDASLLQFSEGFCELKASAGAKAADYLKQSGFSNKAVTEFQTAFDQANVADKVCVYPQTSVDRVVSYKTEDKLNNNRVWFVVVADNQQATTKKTYTGKLVALATRPKADGFATLKKNSAKRQIASENEILAEEWALGFVVEK